jgi:two-component system, sensor histidine kinase and response regulator
MNKYKILVAEDNKINVKVAEFTLRSIASQLDFAHNGMEVLEKIAQNQYDVVMMDVKMPIMDGYETTKTIRKMEHDNPELKPLKIIAITANNQPEEVKYCKSIGMDDFLSKPFTTSAALACIQMLFEADL